MLLEIAGLSARYGGIQAILKADLSVPEKAVVAILGANGAGKSTLLGSVMGAADASTTGSIRYDGREILGRAAEDLVGEGIALVPEGRQLFADLTVRENLRMGAYLQRDRNRIESDMARVLRLFPRLQERQGQLARTLSGGEQQMVAIGRALMSRPRLLLLDEPSLGLAPVLVKEIMRLIQQINRQGVAVLLVEQNAVQALRIADLAYVLEKGCVALGGPASELATNPAVTASYLGDTVSAPASSNMRSTP